MMPLSYLMTQRFCFFLESSALSSLLRGQTCSIHINKGAVFFHVGLKMVWMWPWRISLAVVATCFSELWLLYMCILIGDRSKLYLALNWLAPHSWRQKSLCIQLAVFFYLLPGYRQRCNLVAMFSQSPDLSCTLKLVGVAHPRGAQRLFVEAQKYPKHSKIRR